MRKIVFALFCTGWLSACALSIMYGLSIRNAEVPTAVYVNNETANIAGNIVYEPVISSSVENIKVTVTQSYSEGCVRASFTVVSDNSTIK
jgi:hypothetical protein